MLEALKNIQRMEAAIIDKYAERNAWLDDMDTSWMDADDIEDSLCRFRDNLETTTAIKVDAVNRDMQTGHDDAIDAHQMLLNALGMSS